jgi:sarcosine oxidase subunit gamma
VTVEMRSPLGARAADLAQVAETTALEVVLEHVPFLAQVDLRLAADDARSAPYPLPLEPNSAWEDGPRAALWLGPDEWLILGRPGDGAVIVSELETALAGVHHSAVDVGANRVALEISGPRSKEVLSKGCSLDLDARGGWAAGRCAQTLLARVPVILQERADTTGILVRPSFAEYLVDWLIDAAAQ